MPVKDVPVLGNFKADMISGSQAQAYGVVCKPQLQHMSDGTHQTAFSSMADTDKYCTIQLLTW